MFRQLLYGTQKDLLALPRGKFRGIEENKVLFGKALLLSQGRALFRGILLQTGKINPDSGHEAHFRTQVMPQSGFIVPAVHGQKKIGAGGGKQLRREQKFALYKAAPVVEEKIDFSKVVIEPLFEDTVDFETFSKSDFRAVKVLNCEAVKKSKKLLQFTLDDGTGKERTILSGIHAYYEPEQLVGKTLLAITNLPPRPMMGIESCGMLISAVHTEEGEEKLHLLMLDPHIPAGAKMY